ncbi:MAG: class I SAM-dependent methyltransferase [Bryobacteraceae bacterium]|nr:class I SAM-dependent methyltransferase [Bryobacteraceae bacterium]
MHHRLSYISFPALLLTPCLFAAPPPGEGSLEAAQAALFDAYGRRDAAAVVALLHDNYLGFSLESDSPMDWAGKPGEERRKYFADLFAGYGEWNVALDEPHYRVTGEAGIVSGIERGARSSAARGQELFRWPASFTWLKTSVGWRLLASHRSTFPAVAPGSPPLAKTAEEKQLIDVALASPRWANVPLGDARLLRLLTEAMGARHALEIGTSTGLSGLWLLNALRTTGGRLTTLELDAGRVAIARRQFERAGVAERATVIQGDAHQTILGVEGPVDLVFIDAEKPGYPDYFRKALGLVRPGGLIIGHNVRWPAPSPEFIEAITTNPDLETVFVNMDDQGLSLTLKKR